MECILYDGDDNEIVIEVNNFLDNVDGHSIEFVLTDDNPYSVIGDVLHKQLRKQTDTTNGDYKFDLTIDSFHYYDCFITCLELQDLDCTGTIIKTIVRITFTRRLPILPKGL